MPVAAGTAELRIRLEGALETLDRATLQLARLEELAHQSWLERPLEVHEAVEAWKSSAAQRTAARHAAAREPHAAPWLEELKAREQRLLERLDEVLQGTAVVRRRSLDEKVDTWGRLSTSLGPHPSSEPLAVGEGITRSREWLVTLGAAVAVVLMQQPLLALLLAPIGLVWWDFCKGSVRWRMFKDCLELSEPDLPLRRVPLESIEQLDPDHLLGLWDVSLRGESGFLELAVDVRRALTERATLEKYGSNPELALWVSGSLHHGEPARAQHGWVLSCERGLVFVPDSAITFAWYTVMGGPPHDPSAELGAELRALPAKLFEEKVVELGRSKFCVNLSRLGHEAFQSLGAEILLVVVDTERRLFLNGSLVTQAKLLERVGR